MKSNPRQVSVFLVEDETLIRMMIAGMAEELGHTVVAEAGNIKDALTLARNANFEIAVLDINVGGERIEPVAEIVAGRDLPDGVGDVSGTRIAKIVHGLPPIRSIASRMAATMLG